MRERDWVIGYDRIRDTVLRYYTVEEAMIRADTYKVVVAVNVREAKEKYLEEMQIDNDNGE